jgi:hypothetical protein
MSLKELARYCLPPACIEAMKWLRRTLWLSPRYAP